MKKLIFLLIIILSYTSFSQNLVPNPSFEYPKDFNNMPPQDYGDECDNIDGKYGCPPWFEPYWPCYILRTFNSDPAINYKAPKNLFGYQYPRTGNVYILISTYFDVVCHGEDSKDKIYIEVKLTKPLEKGKKYNARYFVSLTDISLHAIDRLGIYFSKDTTFQYPEYTSYGAQLAIPIPVVPQIKNPPGRLLSDTVNWIPVEGTYIAEGGEQFITIGDFTPDSITYGHEPPVRVRFDNMYHCLCLYYIDDVAVWEDNATTFVADAGENLTVCDGDTITLGSTKFKIPVRPLNTIPDSLDTNSYNLDEYTVWWEYSPLFSNLEDTLLPNPIIIAKSSPRSNIFKFILHVKDFKFDETTDTITIIINDNCITTNNNVSKSTNDFNLFYNPIDFNLTIELINKNININNCYLEIYNLIGNKIKSIPINSNILTTNLYPINNGLYFYKIINNNITLKTGKVLIF